MEGFWILLALSFPVFYILGIANVVSWFRRKSGRRLPRGRHDRVRDLIDELEPLAGKHPKRTLTEQVALFHQELGVVAAEVQSKPASETEIAHPTQASGKSLWSRWYETNSINLLLYIGAFFIIASAAIFVSFQWETISGVMKANMLTLCCLVFFACGLWFYRVPKIKNAGVTFLAIASLLIPIVGAGWYTFVFASVMPNPGPVWLVTSGLALLIYCVLALVMRSSFYSYLATLSSLSIILSFIMLNQLPSTFYILGGMIASFLLLVVSTFLERSGKLVHDTFLEPVTGSSQVLMPVSLLFGVIKGVESNALISLEGTLSLFVASFYYGTLYVQKPNGIKAAATEILFSLCVAVFGAWQGYRLLDVSLFLAAIAFFYLLLPTYYRSHQEAGDTSLIVGFTQLVILFLLHIFNDTTGVPLLLFNLFTVAGAVLVAYVKKKPAFITVATALFALFLYLAYDQHLISNFSDTWMLGLLYTFLGIAGFAGIIRYHDRRELLAYTVPGTTLYLSLGFFFTLSTDPAFLAVTLTLSLILGLSGYLFRKDHFTYGSVALLTLSVFVFHSLSNADDKLLPLFVTVLAFLLYAASRFLIKPLALALRTSSLLLMLATPVFFGLVAMESDEKLTELYALFTAYAALVLYGIDYALHRSKFVAYTLSAIAMGTYLWQIEYFSVSEMLVYTLPPGGYFLTLGYLNRSKNQEPLPLLLDGLGLAFLLGPSSLGVYGDESMKHSVVLFVLGIAFLASGITLSRALYRKAGIAALMYATFANTYTYLFQLPRWVIVGVLGILLIGSAIFLLLKRTEAKE